ncbi:hypothetical protein ACHHYP_02686 [Achlya hypogyna]|uniref:C2 NT-type domain-containing protein n=1 Tax=Achlya hypogyna TaxID=1202772 RepID=A0A1V9ZS65_ACHHY|nr:hypothetical protein ACHHYP_02686 [Achlya hypogyna]
MFSFRSPHQPVVADFEVEVDGCYNVLEGHPVVCVYKYGDGRRGESYAADVINQTARWPGWRISLPHCRLDTVNGTLQPRCLRLSLHRVTTPAGGRRMQFGVVDVDIADFIGRMQASRRYLLQQSNLNATLHIVVHTKQVHGDVLYKPRCPPRPEIPTDTCFVSSTSVRTRALPAKDAVHAIVIDILRTSEEQRSRHLPSK